MRVLIPALLLAVASFCPGQQPKTQSKSAGPATATGVFLGRSGKPMAGARIILAQVSGDEQVAYARLRLVPNIGAVVDRQGHFQLRGFTPGNYAILYQPAGASAVLPTQTSLKPLLAVTPSPMPLLRDVEIGKGESYPDRDWGPQLTLLKGHTFFAQGANMRVWNATIRRKPAGPYMEVRKGVIWMEKLADKSQIKLEAWSY